MRVRLIARKKEKLIAINSNVLFCIKQDLIVNGVKSGHSFNRTKKIPMPSSVLFAVKKSCSYQGKLLIFFNSCKNQLKGYRKREWMKVESWNLHWRLVVSEWIFYILFLFSFQSHLPFRRYLIPRIMLSHLAWQQIL